MKYRLRDKARHVAMTKALPVFEKELNPACRGLLEKRGHVSVCGNGWSVCLIPSEIIEEPESDDEAADAFAQMYEEQIKHRREEENNWAHFAHEYHWASENGY